MRRLGFNWGGSTDRLSTHRYTNPPHPHRLHHACGLALSSIFSRDVIIPQCNASAAFASQKHKGSAEKMRLFRLGPLWEAEWHFSIQEVSSASGFKNKIIKKKEKRMFHFLSTGIDERNQAERHVGRLSHLSTVGPALVETQARRGGGGGLPRAFGNISGESLFKDGIIANIQQRLSALCKRVLSAPSSEHFVSHLLPRVDRAFARSLGGGADQARRG